MMRSFAHDADHVGLFDFYGSDVYKKAEANKLLRDVLTVPFSSR